MRTAGHTRQGRIINNTYVKLKTSEFSKTSCCTHNNIYVHYYTHIDTVVVVLATLCETQTEHMLYI